MMTSASTETSIKPPTTSSQRDWLWMSSVILALAGLLDMVYLVWTKLSSTEAYCPPGATFNCDLVQNSIYSKIGPIPIQFIGLAGYLAILAVLLLEKRVTFFAQRGKLLVFVMTLIGFLYSAYLTGIEAFVLQAWCLYCLISAVIMTGLFAVAFIRMWRSFGADAASVEAEA